MVAIAVAQTVPLAGDVDANLAEHLRLIEVAARQRAKVVLFPELSLTGYEMEAAPRLAFSMDDRRLAPLVRAAAAHDITVIAGAPVREGDALHIGALIFTRTSIALYTKHHLGAFGDEARCDGDVPPPEAGFFSAGKRNPEVTVGGVPAAIAVCADFGRASHAASAAARGARAYLASAFVIPSEYERDAEKLRTYAKRHSMLVALANFGGPSGGLAAAGRSAVWSASGERLVELPATGSGVAVVDDAGARSIV